MDFRKIAKAVKEVPKEKQPAKEGRVVICVTPDLERRFENVKSGRVHEVLDSCREFLTALVEELESRDHQKKDPVSGIE